MLITGEKPDSQTQQTMEELNLLERIESGKEREFQDTS